MLTPIHANIVAAAFIVCQNTPGLTSVLERDKTQREMLFERLPVFSKVEACPSEEAKSVFFAEIGCSEDCSKPHCDEACNTINRQ